MPRRARGFCYPVAFPHLIDTTMVMWPVDKRVGNVRNNDAALIEPVVLA